MVIKVPIMVMIIMMIVMPIMLVETMMCVIMMRMFIMVLPIFETSMMRIDQNMSTCSSVMWIIVIVMVIMMVVVMIVVMIIMVEIFMPISERMMWLCLVREKILNVMMLNAVLCLSFDVVEQLIIFMFNIRDNLLSMVEFNIMRIVVVVVAVLFHVMVIMTVMMSIFPVSMSCMGVESTMMRGSVMSNWLMHSVVSVKVRIVLNSVNIVVRIMSWVELVTTRVVVKSSVMMISNVMVCIMEVIRVMWSLVVCIMMDIMMYVVVYVVMDVMVNAMMWDIMNRFIIMYINVVNFMVDVSWVVSISMVLSCSYFRVDIINPMVKIMPVMSVRVVIMILHMSLNHFVMVFMAIVIFILNVWVLWVMDMFVFFWDMKIDFMMMIVMVFVIMMLSSMIIMEISMMIFVISM